MSPNLSNLPPELQQRLASLLNGPVLPESPHQAAIAPSQLLLLPLELLSLLLVE